MRCSTGTLSRLLGERRSCDPAFELSLGLDTQCARMPMQRAARWRLAWARAILGVSAWRYPPSGGVSVRDMQL